MKHKIFHPSCPDVDKTQPKVLLGYWTCYLIDIPDKCPSEEIPQETDMYSCMFKTKYLAGENAGPVLCVILCGLITMVGLVGVASNIVNIMVLRHSTKGSSLQTLLIILAGFDMLASCCAVLTCMLLQIISDDIDRKKATLIAFKVSFLLYSLGRTGSIYMTILITIERYFVVAHHFWFKAWLNSRRSLVLVLLWLFLILLINLPWWLNSVIHHNHSRITLGFPLSKLPFFYVATNFGTWYMASWLRPIHIFIDFVLPFPLLLLFNGFLYRFIHKWTKRREALTGSHIREMNAAKMFSIIVLALLSCHIFAIIDFIVTQITNTVYRELILFIMLAVTLNATVNCFVYYAFGQDYREYFWLLVGSVHRQKGTTDPAAASSVDDMPGRDSPEEDVILHEDITYTKRHGDADAEESLVHNDEHSSLLMTVRK